QLAGDVDLFWIDDLDPVLLVANLEGGDDGAARTVGGLGRRLSCRRGGWAGAGRGGRAGGRGRARARAGRGAGSWSRRWTGCRRRGGRRRRGGGRRGGGDRAR